MKLQSCSFRGLAVFATLTLSAFEIALGALSVGTNGVLLREGAPYRGIGVNYFNCFSRTLADGADVSYEAGFRTLAAYQIPFVRFSATGYWPIELRLYQTNRGEFFRRLDRVVRSAEKHGIGLIPSLFWYYACVPDLVSEPVSAWGDRGSRTHSFMRQYTREVVSRYRHSASIWAWEFGNEFNLQADLPNAPEHRAAIWPQLGTAVERSARDDLSHDAIAVAFSEFGREVRRHDPMRCITSGDSFPRASAWHQRREENWKKDSPEQFVEMIRLMTPPPLNMISVHCYDEQLGRIPEATRVAGQIALPLFVGEFQVPSSDKANEGRNVAFTRFLRDLEKHRVSLAAAWVFDYKPHEAEFNITSANARSWQLEAIRDWNRIWSRGNSQ